MTTWQGEWLRVRRQPALLWVPNVFVIVLLSFFALALGSTESLNARAAVTWFCVLVMTILSMQSSFDDELRHGVLAVTFAEISSPSWHLAHSLLMRGLPVAIAGVLAVLLSALWLRLPRIALLPSVLAVLLATPALCLLALVGSALTAGVRQAGWLMFALVAPLYVPLLIFGVSSTLAAAQQQVVWPALQVLLALSLLAIVLLPWVIAQALKLSVSN